MATARVNVDVQVLIAGAIDQVVTDAAYASTARAAAEQIASMPPATNVVHELEQLASH